jgi:L-2-hydroxyglutarate oxidase LhgO
VHFTQRVHGGVDAGPNAVLALKREGYRWRDVSVRDTAQLLGYKGFWHMAQKHWRTGLNEIYRSLSKASFVKALQKLIPEISASDLVTDGSGVRAQAVKSDGSLVDDFQFIRRANILNVYNVPSPAATASIAVGQQIAQMAGQEFEFSGF